MNPIADAIVAFLLIAGAFFVLVGSVGLVKLSEFFRRLHGPTKSSTLGVGCILIAAMVIHLATGGGLGLRAVLITAFLFITAPISAHLMAKAALSLEARADAPSAEDARPDTHPDA